jgi:hypothetical protein
VQEVEIETVSAETGKARLARARCLLPAHESARPWRPEHVISPIGNRTADELRGPVLFRRVDQRHPEGKTRTQRFFFSGLSMSPLPKTRGPWAEGRASILLALGLAGVRPAPAQCERNKAGWTWLFNR